MGSSRLPGKSLRPLRGRPLIHHVVERAQAIGVDHVILCTSLSERDAALAVEADRLGVSWFRGSEWDVLERLAQAAAGYDVVMRLTGDCSFLAPEVSSLVLAEFLSRSVDYCSNDTTCTGYPDGTDTEVMSWVALDWACARALDRHDREHVTPYIRRHARTHTVYCETGDFSRYKLSVDTLADYEFAQRIAAHIRSGDFGLPATIAAAQKVLGV